MTSVYETGHAINIANFKRLIDRCEEFGTDYNPPNSDISILNMSGKWTAVDALHSSYLNALSATKNPINDREVLFDKLRTITVRTVNLYGSTKASKQSIEDAKGYLRKLTGRNAITVKLPDGSADPARISRSQQSFVKKVEHFEKLVKLYETDNNYAPNETDLQVANLEIMLSDLKTTNVTVDKLIAHTIKARTDRDHGLYDIKTGLIDLAMACKKYVKGKYGAQSPEAMSVVAIKLRRIMKLT